MHRAVLLCRHAQLEVEAHLLCSRQFPPAYERHTGSTLDRDKAQEHSSRRCFRPLLKPNYSDRTSPSGGKRKRHPSRQHSQAQRGDRLNVCEKILRRFLSVPQLLGTRHRRSRDEPQRSRIRSAVADRCCRRICRDFLAGSGPSCAPGFGGFAFRQIRPASLRAARHCHLSRFLHRPAFYA